jgi:hypothetical protein
MNNQLTITSIRETLKSMDFYSARTTLNAEIGKEIEVTGSIIKISETRIVLNSEMRVYCHFTDDGFKSANPFKRQIVKIKGEISSFGFEGINLRNCELI